MGKNCVRSQAPEQEGLSRFRDDRHQPDREKVASSEEEAERKTCQGEKNAQTRQQEGLSRFRDVTGKADQAKVETSDKDVNRRSRTKRASKRREKSVSRERNVKQKEFQEMTQSTAVTGKRSGFVPIGPPFLYRLPHVSKLPSPGLPGVGWYMHINIITISMYLSIHPSIYLFFYL